MTTALWIIAGCEIFRNLVLIVEFCIGSKQRSRLNNEFINSLKKDNKQWLESTLRDCLDSYDDDDIVFSEPMNKEEKEN